MLNMCTHVIMSISLSLSLYIYIYMCIYIHIYIYTHTHTFMAYNEGPEARVVPRERRDVRLVLAEEDLAAVLAVEVHLAERRVLQVHPPRAAALHLRLLRRVAPGPGVAEERLGHHVQLRLCYTFHCLCVCYYALFVNFV